MFEDPVEVEIESAAIALECDPEDCGPQEVTLPIYINPGTNLGVFSIATAVEHDADFLEFVGVASSQAQWGDPDIFFFNQAPSLDTWSDPSFEFVDKQNEESLLGALKIWRVACVSYWI
jgi:hypothetical protein